MSAKKRVGKDPDSIFGKAQTKTNPIAEKPRKDAIDENKVRGRPPEHKEAWSKVTVVLLEKQINWLDTLALKMRQSTKAKVSRAEIIRAAVAAMEESGIDFTSCINEEDIKASMLNRVNTRFTNA